MNNRDIDKLIHTEIMGHPGRIACRFTEDISLAWQVEEKVKELDLSMEYAKQLYRISQADEGDFLEECWWIMIHATPLQRCLAALEAIKATKKDDYYKDTLSALVAQKESQ